MLRKCKWLVLVVMAVFLVFNSIEVSNAETEVSGIIDIDTTWTLAGSPYILTDNIEIAPGISLTVESGVAVRSIYEHNYSYIYRKSITVFDGGALNITGMLDNRINFERINIYTYDGTIHIGIKLTIEYVDFSQCSIKANVLRLSNCVFSQNINDLHLTGIRLSAYTDGNDATTDEPSYVEQNIFNGPEITVIDVDYTYNNLFHKTRCCTSENCIFKYNSFLDITFSGSWYGNRYYTIDLIENYWGTIDEMAIDEMIIDINDSLSYNYLIGYRPFLLEPHPDTPAFDPDPVEPDPVDPPSNGGGGGGGGGCFVSIINLIY